MRGLKPWVGVLAFVLGLGALAAGFQPPAPPTRWVTDTAGLLSAPTRSRLDARLQRYEQDTGRQVIVWIGDTTGDVPIEEWAARTFEAWGIGRKGKNDGLALFVFAQDRQLRIEVGYGLEALVTDAVAARIIQEQAVPRLRAGNPDGAVDATLDALLRTLGGESAPPTVAPRAQDGSPFWLLWVALLMLVALGALLFFTRGDSGRRGGLGGRDRFPSGGGGGASGSGSHGNPGGFQGGGGRSGGGGASGKW